MSHRLSAPRWPPGRTLPSRSCQTAAAWSRTLGWPRASGCRSGTGPAQSPAKRGRPSAPCPPMEVPSASSCPPVLRGYDEGLVDRILLEADDLREAHTDQTLHIED